MMMEYLDWIFLLLVLLWLGHHTDSKIRSKVKRHTGSSLGESLLFSCFFFPSALHHCDDMVSLSMIFNLHHRRLGY